MTASFRADQIGSFLRPSEVLEARVAKAQGRISAEALLEVEDKAILAVLELQKSAGIEIFSDGEYRRGGWASDFQDAVDGYVAGEAPVKMEWRGAPRTAPAAQGGRVIGAKLQQRRRLTAHESGFLRQHAPGPYKITLPAASYMVARGYKPGVTDTVYSGRAEVLKRRCRHHSSRDRGADCGGCELHSDRQSALSRLPGRVQTRAVADDGNRPGRCAARRHRR